MNQKQTAQGGLSSDPLVATETTVQLTDATTVGGVAWSTLKATAVLSTYDKSSLSADDQLIVDALIAAQNSVALPALTSTPYTTGNAHTDATIIASATWGELRDIAMASGFDSSSFSAADQTFITNLSQAQTTQDGAWTLTATTFVTGGDTLSDSTVVNGRTWAELKVSATDSGFRNRSRYAAMSADDKALIDFLITAQATQGDSLPLASVVYTADDSFVGVMFSPWIDLVAGQKYYTESLLMEWNGAEHHSIGVEIQPTDMSSIPANHPQKTHQYQRLKATQDIARDTMKVTINNPDMKEFVIMFQDPADVTKNIASSKIKAGDTADNFKEAVKTFYEESRTGIAPTVSLHCQDATGTNRTCVASAFNACLNPDNNSEELTCTSC